GYRIRAVPQQLRDLGLTAVQVHAVTDVDQAPLADPVVAELQWWYTEWRKGLQTFLTATAQQQLADWLASSAGCEVFTHPDFWQIRTSLCVMGRVPDAPAPAGTHHGGRTWL
ncbi:MAG: hypothetical protein H0X24_11000, partial [Ktedonobacterales bacterium]|nr:hypothetical protein [Ktedonobacterales bacterium]